MSRYNIFRILKDLYKEYKTFGNTVNHILFPACSYMLALMAPPVAELKLLCCARSLLQRWINSPCAIAGDRLDPG